MAIEKEFNMFPDLHHSIYTYQLNSIRVTSIARQAILFPTYFDFSNEISQISVCVFLSLEV